MIEAPIVPASGTAGRETMQPDPTEPGAVTPDAPAALAAGPAAARRSSKRGLVTLKKRPEFLRLRGGRRWSCPAFAIETRPALPVAAGVAVASGPRFGFTVTKAMGNAVARNRIRRRLKAAVTEAGVSLGHVGHDYVLIARNPGAGPGDRNHHHKSRRADLPSPL